MNSKNKTLAGIGFGVSASLIWGAFAVISTFATNDNLTAMDITASRFAIAGCLLFPLIFIKSMTLKDLGTKGVTLATGAGAPYLLVVLSGLNYAPSSHFGLITPTSMLVFSTLGSYLWMNEKISLSRIAGVVLILFGVVVVSASSFGQITLNTLIGDLMFLFGGFLWAVYTLLSKHWRIEPWSAITMVSVVSMVVFMPLYLINYYDTFSDKSISAWFFQAIYQGVLSAIVALYCYSKAISLLGTAKGAVFSALVPPITLVLCVVLLGEQISGLEKIGLGLVSMGMLLALELLRLPFLSTSAIKPSM